ncbi:HAD family hydrolase [Uliginosibacterium paludis]|uniref:D,D-heptose 1,7-bisphosphate phosphatase n=1 Tax=Uliginosibacterium paludis TaxID=1615952 RepID=A0ABV2CTG3_9RHOO
MRCGAAHHVVASMRAVPDLPPGEGPARLSGSARPAVFLDKDGTLIEDVPHNVDPAQLRFTKGAVPALRLLGQAGFPLVIVTNQPGVSMGLFTRHQLKLLEQALRARVRQEAGVELAGMYVCPHAPAPPGGLSCLCRKPAPGLLRQAAVAGHYDLARSWMVGDILDDIEAGARAGCRTILLDRGSETIWRMTPLRKPDYRCSDLLQAARIILGVRGEDTRLRPPGASGNLRE